MTLHVGPLYVSSMFRPENIWGTLGGWASNKAHPESSMLMRLADMELAARQLKRLPTLSTALRRNLTSDTPGDWAPEPGLASALSQASSVGRGVPIQLPPDAQVGKAT